MPDTRDVLDLLEAAEAVVAEYRVLFPAGPTAATRRLWITETPDRYERLDRAARAVRESLAEVTYEI